MATNLKPSEALSQVVFVHDYIQLVFQDEVFNIYNLGEVVHNKTVIRQGQSGFCDALVSLIDQRVTSVSVAAPYKLSLKFESGFRFRVLSDDEGSHGPEAFEFRGPNNQLVIESNA